jgi:phospholipid/cholesterol/gamma-HCH transport system permease protein
MAQSIEQGREEGALVLRPRGRWVVSEAAALDRSVAQIRAGGAKRARIDLSHVEAIDTAGAWLLLRLKRGLESAGAEVSLVNMAEAMAPLMRQVETTEKTASRPPPRRHSNAFLMLLNYLGRRTVELLWQSCHHLGFFGQIIHALGRAALNPRRLRFVPLVAQMERAGVSALGIVGLLSFLIGIVMTYIGAQQLKAYGAEIFTVNLLAVGVLRELGCIMTAIIVAGRSGSAFTAEIGAMVVNEEVDAIRTLGLDPVDVLVVPRILGLVVTLPFLTFWANLTALAGGAVMCWAVLDIPLGAFLDQLRSAVSMWSLFLGIIKSPFFAVSIGLIGCNEGLMVERSAASVGRHTTQSVVQSIFMVIVLDAAFSVLFNDLHI